MGRCVGQSGTSVTSSSEYPIDNPALQCSSYLMLAKQTRHRSRQDVNKLREHGSVVREVFLVHAQFVAAPSAANT